MKLLEILEKAILKEFANYGEALEELKKLQLPYEDQEKYETILHKLLGGNEKVFHYAPYCFFGIFNEKYFPILQEAISLIRDGLYSPEIAQHLYDKYALSPALITYFINEGLSIVKMNNLSPEEISSIGEAYHRIASHLESKGIKEKPIVQNNEVNAIDIDTDIFEEENDD